MAQYRTISVTEDLWLFGGKSLNEHIQIVTANLGESGWRVLNIARANDGKTADIQFVRP